MSHHPVHYDYPPSPPENYYLGEPEMYPGDYQDSGCIQDNEDFREVPQDIMEFYGRNATVVPVQVVRYSRKHVPKQHSEQYIQQAYYNRGASRSPRSHYSKTYDPLREYYPVATCSQHDTVYNTKPYADVYSTIEQYPPTTPPRNSVPKKFPVTFPTPKYYRKVPSPLYRRPSALCLPLATKPDPAVVYRPRKIPVFVDNKHEGVPPVKEDIPLESPKKSSDKPPNEYEAPHVVDCQGDVNMKMPNFDELFEQVEKGAILPNDTKKEMAKFAKLLKPRLPPSLRAKQEKIRSKIPRKVSPNNRTHNPTTTTPNTNPVNNANNKNEFQQDLKKDVLEPTQESLEKLLNQLKKCELAMHDSKKNSSMEKEKHEDGKEGKVEDKKRNEDKRSASEQEVLKSNMSSFNYQDISENINCKNNLERSHSVEHLSKQQLTSASNSFSTKPKLLTKPTLDDHCALELHKSKSYIVNLIDRALSKELGTVPCTRCYKNMDNTTPKQAIEVLEHHMEKPEKDLQLNNSLTESHLSNFSGEETVDVMDEDKTSSSKSKICRCGGLDEPLYIKQLKKLRWGHLKHIQREVKRLEELERFLDSCSITTIQED